MQSLKVNSVRGYSGLKGAETARPAFYQPQLRRRSNGEPIAGTPVHQKVLRRRRF